MNLWAISCLLGCLALPIYFGGRRIKYLLGIRPMDEYMNRSYDFEGYPMLRWIRLHVPHGTKILYLGIIPEGPQYYYQDYDLISMTTWPPVFYLNSIIDMSAVWKYEGIEYVIMVKKDMHHNADGSWTNTYLAGLNITVPALSEPLFQKVYETDKAILYRVPPPKE
jgi:hypothetical protein